MPQNAIIKADGSEDYTSDIAWEAAEQNSDYGSITIARLDGNITRTERMSFDGAWVNGGRIEALNNAFDGDINNNPPTITSTGGNNFIRNFSGKTLELAGIAMIQGGSVGALDVRTLAGTIKTFGCYVKVLGSVNVINLSNGGIFDDDGSVFDCQNIIIAGSSSSNTTLNNTTIFTDHGATVLSAGTFNNVVLVNAIGGTCFGGGVTQSNNASTDATADNLTNIVVATEFVDATPVASGDFRIKAGSDLDANGIGAFIQSAGGISVTVTETLNSFADSSVIDIEHKVTFTVTETLSAFTDNSILAVTSVGEVSVSVTEVLSSFLDSSVINLSANIAVEVTEVLNSFLDGSNVTIAKDITVEVTEVLASFADNSFIKLPSVWVNKPAVVTNYTAKTPVTTIWTDKG